MWENRPAVEILVNSPCHNCKDRTQPKTCEKGCKKWELYKQQKKIAEEKYNINKRVDRMFYEKFTQHSKKG